MRGMRAHVLLRLVCSLSDGLAGLLLRNVQEKPHQRLDAAPERGEVDALVGPVDVVLREAETGEHRVDTEKILKLADNRYPGSDPIEKRSRSPSFFEGPAERHNSGGRAGGGGGVTSASAEEGMALAGPPARTCRMLSDGRVAARSTAG